PAISVVQGVRIKKAAKKKKSIRALPPPPPPHPAEAGPRSPTPPHPARGASRLAPALPAFLPPPVDPVAPRFRPRAHTTAPPAARARGGRPEGDPSHPPPAPPPGTGSSAGDLIANHNRPEGGLLWASLPAQTPRRPVSPSVFFPRASQTQHEPEPIASPCPCG